MRLTRILRAQHLDWHFKKHWRVQGKRIPVDTGAKEVLNDLNIEVIDAVEYANKKPLTLKFTKLELDNVATKVETIKDKPLCFVYQNNHVLLEGLSQARVLTNTIEITTMPKRIEEIIEKNLISSVVDRNIQELVLASHVYDAEQQKTAKIKIPERPAFNLPRNYGITDNRKSLLTTSKLIFECEKLLGRTISGKRQIVNDVNFITTFMREESKIQLNIPVQVLITSDRQIEPFKEKYDSDIPDLFPLKCTISIPKMQEIPTNDFYPLQKEIKYSHPHTVIIYHSPEFVKNVTEIPVTTTQYQARTLLAAFATASARAQQLYGKDVKVLPMPIVVHSVQTDGKTFHFGVYQLNTLDLDNVEGVKNYWFHIPSINLFEECSYIDGRPVLQGYNKDVIKYMKAFYQNN